MTHNCTDETHIKGLQKMIFSQPFEWSKMVWGFKYFSSATVSNQGVTCHLSFGICWQYVYREINQVANDLVKYDLSQSVFLKDI